MDPAQVNYTITEKELLAIIFALDKFCAFFLGSKVIVFSDHAILKYLLKKLDAKPRLIRWMLLFQEFNLEIKDKKGADNTVVDHFSRIQGRVDSMPIRDDFPNKQLLQIAQVSFSLFDKQNTTNNALINPYLWRFCNDQIMRRCIPNAEFLLVLHFYHSAPKGGHYGSNWTARKCQQAGLAISRRNEMPQQPVLICEIFYVWGIDFMGPFLISNGYSYILLVINYITKWVEATATRTNDAKVVVDFLKFDVPKALISDLGTHFYNRAMSSLLEKYGVLHIITTPYHPQTNGQAEVLIREIKKTLQKMANPNRKDWSRLLEDSLWDHKIAYQTLLGMSPYRIMFSKAYHLPKVKQFHNHQILREEFKVGQKVLLFNSRLKLIAGKLHSRWDDPFVITNIFPYGAVELRDEASNKTFQ
ncbi:Tf2-9, partial [Mucuna pruriens]